MQERIIIKSVPKSYFYSVTISGFFAVVYTYLFIFFHNVYDFYTSWGGYLWLIGSWLLFLHELYMHIVYSESEVTVTDKRVIRTFKHKATIDIPIEKITAYNDELLKMAARNEWYFVDTYSAVCNFSGYLDSDMSSDGVHMKPDLYKAFSEYILSHTAD